MNYEELLLETKDNIATITLNNPAKLNPVGQKMGRSICLAVEEIAQDNEVRVVIVTGAGRGFCSGADVSAMGTRVDSSGSAVEIPRNSRFQVVGQPWAVAFPRLHKPVIAAINGSCAGGGFSLALSCDIRIASEAATFVVSQVARAICPDAGMTYYLPQVIGISNAMKLMFTAEKIGAAEAERLGIVSQVVPPDKLMEVSRELAARIAQQPPLSMEATKTTVWASLFDALERQFALEGWAGQKCSGTEDNREAVRAFLEKRPPAPFKGR